MKVEMNLFRMKGKVGTGSSSNVHDYIKNVPTKMNKSDAVESK